MTEKAEQCVTPGVNKRFEFAGGAAGFRKLINLLNVIQNVCFFTVI